MQDLIELLKANPYPGRGIVVGNGTVYYWIMGRSANSRNRVFVKTDDGIRTEAYKPELVEDPSLIIYHPVRTMGEDLVVTNGDQTDTIVEAGEIHWQRTSGLLRGSLRLQSQRHCLRHRPHRWTHPLHLPHQQQYVGILCAGLSLRHQSTALLWTVQRDCGLLQTQQPDLPAAGQNGILEACGHRAIQGWL